MRRIKLFFAVAVTAILLAGSAAPAMAAVNFPNCFPFCDNNDHRLRDNFFRDDGRNLFRINDGRRFFDNDRRRFFINDGRRFVVNDGRRFFDNDGRRFFIDHGRGFGIGQGFSQESESGNANLVIR